MVAQYMVVLAEDASSYDIISVEDDKAKKYSFVSVLISVKTGEATNISLGYVIDYVMTNNELYDKDDENNYFTDKFENIAYIKPIVDKKILYSPAYEDIVLMDNEAVAKKSLKMVSYQEAEIPEKISDGLYAIDTIDGGAVVVDKKGKIIHAFNNSVFSVVGGYLVSDRVVYDMNLEIVYNLSGKDVELLEFMGDTILIKNGTDEEYSIIAIFDGKVETVYTHTEKSKTQFGILASYFYYIEDKDGNFEYFNEKGESLLTSAEELVFVGMSYEYDTILLASTGENVKYYVVKK